MADKNKRDWFATGDSDEEEQGYDSADEESMIKSFTGRNAKPRKLNRNDSEDEEDESEDKGSTSFKKAKESLSKAAAVDEHEEDDIVLEDAAKRPADKLD